jgi:hypothetical protein
MCWNERDPVLHILERHLRYFLWYTLCLSCSLPHFWSLNTMVCSCYVFVPFVSCLASVVVMSAWFGYNWADVDNIFDMRWTLQLLFTAFCFKSRMSIRVRAKIAQSVKWLTGMDSWDSFWSWGPDFHFAAASRLVLRSTYFEQSCGSTQLSASREFPHVCATPWFITMFTRASYLAIYIMSPSSHGILVSTVFITVPFGP